MKLFIFVVLFSLVAASYANIFEDTFSDPEHPGKCVRDGIVLSPGEEKQLQGKCERFICNKDDGFSTILSCDRQVLKPGCKFGDYLEPKGVFPYCCTRYYSCD